MEFLFVSLGKIIQQFKLKVSSFIGACTDFNDELLFNCYHIGLIENSGH